MKRPFSIGLFVPQLDQKYGGERYTQQLADELAKSCDVVVYCLSATGARPKRATVRAKGHQYHGATAPLRYWAAMRAVGRKAAQHDVMLGVHVAGALGAAIAARRRNVPFVYICLEPPRFLYDLSDAPSNRILGSLGIARWLRNVDRRTVQQAASIVAISDFVQHQVSTIYGRPSMVIYPGIDLDPFKVISKEDARNSLALPRDAKVYLSMSKLHSRKDIASLIDLFASEAALGDVLAIVGDGPEEQNLRRHASKYFGRDIRFTGYVSDQRRAMWLRASDIFLFNAKNEPFGIAPLEAKGMGLQVKPKVPPYPILTPQECADEILVVLKKSVHAADSI